MPTESDDGPVLLCTRNLGKRYGRRWVVDDFNLQLHAGDICGLLGPNGAGKTTTLRLLTGLAVPSTGSVEIDGHDLTQDRVQALMHVGALVESPGLFLHMSGYRNLINMVRLQPNLPASQRQIQVNRLLEAVKLADRATDKVGAYSLGMRQRLGLALALLGSPKLLILDEPANGLDPLGIRQLRQLILNLRDAAGITFLISSHQLSEVEQVCNRFFFMDHGRVLAHHYREELLITYGSLEEAFVHIVYGGSVV